jgi:signal transduction histidine kinase
MSDPLSPSSARRGLSLERKLPLLVTALLLLIVGTVFVVVYHEVMRSSRLAAAERLRRITPELAASAEASVRRTAERFARVGNDSTIRRALTGGSVLPAGLEAEVHKELPRGDSVAAIMLWTARGLPVSPAELNEPEPALPAGDDRIPARDDSVRYGPLHASGGQVFYWVVGPLTSGRRRVGWLGVRRRIRATAEAEKTIHGLFGRNVEVYYRNNTGDFWTTFAGVPVKAPTDVRVDAGVETRARPDSLGTSRVIAAHAPINGTSWTLAVEQPLSVIAAAPRVTITRLLLFTVVVLLVGIAAVWAISRRLVRPLTALALAAESIAGGDYSRRVGAASVGRRDEIGRLAASFNYMADEVSASHTELEQQVEEAQSLSEELEEANNQLQDSTLAAEEARDAAEAARREAEEANRAKSAFLATMSHELRTPLNAIAGYTALLEMGIRGPVTSEQREDLERITRSQRTLLTLVEDVLSFARIEAGRVEYQVKELPLDETLAGMEALIAPQALAKGITYEYRPAGAEARVWGDHEKLERIILNLLSNAVKFTDRGGRITLASEMSNDVVLVRVTDTGQGIDPVQLESIFEPFTQGERGLTRTTEGTGLGLAISREFARGMGGDLTVESTPARGSTFTVLLPSRSTSVRVPSSNYASSDTTAERLRPQSS